MTLRSSDAVVVVRDEGGWTCGYLAARRGAAQGWIRAKDIRPLTFDAKPPLSAWLGTWKLGDGRITIQSSNGRLQLDGESYWHGFGDNVHSGEFSGQAIPSGGHLQVEDDACKIDLALWGQYLLANDNDECGGANVRFWGVWRRAK